jgi:periplasmic divalent cation tolerance protein
LTEFIIVVTTTDSKENAEIIAGVLMEKKLAGCVQIVGPITSTFRWKGRLETSTEWQCLAKSREDLFADIAEAIRAVHPYEVPEICAMPISAASEDYRTWLSGELADRQDRQIR